MEAPQASVVVTGLGVVSPIGIGRQQFWSALCAGVSGVAPVSEDGAASPPTARIEGFSARPFIASTHLRRADPLSCRIVAAVRMALADAGLEDSGIVPERTGVVVGSALGNVGESVSYLERLFTRGPALVSPMAFPNLVLNAPASYAAMEIGASGANLTVSQGEISGERALGLGCELIRAGRADVVLAGGGDELADIVRSAYRSLRALSGQRGGPQWCSPYDVERNGVVLGEGAAMLVLEASEHARRRGATVYAEIEDHVDFGIAAPPYDWPVRAPQAPAHLRAFLQRHLPPEGRIDLVCGSANSSRRLDACELDTLSRLFGEAATTVALTSIKGAIGEFGAAGALTAVAACLALHDGLVPPLCHLRHPPAASGLRLAPQAAETRPLRRALMLSLARGGAATALLLRRPNA